MFKENMNLTDKENMNLTDKENMNLTDIWRDLHPDIQRLTWRRGKPGIHCRLDFFLISSSLSTDALEADILPGLKNRSLSYYFVSWH